MRSTRSILVLSALVATSGLAACGGSTTIAFGEWQDQANEVCGDFEDQFQELEDFDSIEEFRDNVAEGAGLIRDQVGELRDLDDPDEREDEVDELLDRAEQVADDAEAAAAIDDDDEFVTEAFESVSTGSDELDRQSDDLGLDKCVGADDQQLPEGVDTLQEAIAQSFTALGLSEQQALCVANELIDEFGPARFLELSLANDPAIQSAGQKAGQNCS